VATQVLVVDDLDGSPDAQTFRFGWDGAYYDIDLSEKNATEVASYFKDLIAAGRIAKPGAKLLPAPVFGSGDKSEDTSPPPVKAVEQAKRAPVEEQPSEPEVPTGSQEVPDTEEPDTEEPDAITAEIPPTTSQDARPGPTQPEDRKEQMAAVRAWAARTGRNVAARGRVPKGIIAAYNAANPSLPDVPTA
jgi:hypothetical protein